MGEQTRRLRPLLGTFVQIQAAGERAAVQGALEAAFAAVRRVQTLMSFHDPGSDVSRINRAPRRVPVPIDRQTWQVLRFGQELQRLSLGAFDPAVAHALVAHGALPSPLSGADEQREVRAHGDLELLDEGAVRWRRRGLIDLGGIAKGYAVDCAIEALRRHGATAGLVNAGGDLRCYGGAQPVHVRAADGRIVRLGELCEGALATSGDCAQPAGGALVDPHSGSLARWGASISVVADECMSADALTKIVRLCPTRAPDVLGRFAAQAFRIETDGSVRMTAAPAQRQRRLQ